MNLSTKIRALVASHKPQWILNGLALHRFRGVQRVINFYEPNKLSPGIRQKPRWIVVSTEYCHLSVNINEHVGYRYLVQKKFDNTAANVAQKIKMGPGDIFVDIGANIGTVTVPLCAKYGCSSICVEASKSTASKLCENLARNNVCSKVIVAAASSPEFFGDVLTLSIPASNVGAATLFNETIEDDKRFKREKVPIIALDQILHESDIERTKLVKIDVEGGELDVLKGAKRLLAHSVPVLFEYLGREMTGGADRLRGAFPESYEIYAINEEGELSDFDSKKRYRNLIGIPENKLGMFF